MPPPPPPFLGSDAETRRRYNVTPLQALQMVSLLDPQRRVAWLLLAKQYLVYQVPHIGVVKETVSWQRGSLPCLQRGEGSD
jgi:hypothetical protein